MMRSSKRTPRLFPAILLVLFIFVGLPGISISAYEPQKGPYADAEITVKIIPSVNNTFGYDILVHGRPFVHQPNIPGLPGNEGFTTRERAKRAAEFVVKKIRSNEIPPTVTIEDLNGMGVLK